MATPGGGSAPYSYSWSNLAATQSISGLMPGFYYVTVTDINQCQKVGSYFVAPGGCNLSVSVTGTYSNSNSIYSGTGTAVATGSGGNPPYNFEWNTGMVTTGATSSSVSNLPVGTYAVLVTEQNNPNCAVWGNFTVFGPSSVGVIPPSQVSYSVVVYPNPASSNVSFIIPDKNADGIIVYDVMGRKIENFKVSDKSNILSVGVVSGGNLLLSDY